MIKFEKVEIIELKTEGLILKNGADEVFLGWEAIDSIADASEPHYFKQAVQFVQAANEATKGNVN